DISEPPQNNKEKPMTHHRKGRLLSVLLAAALVAAGCGRDDETSGDDTNDTTDNTDNGSGERAAFIDPAQDCDSGWSGTTGVEGDTIRLGTISPKTEAGAAQIYDWVTQGMAAKFKYVNEHGGAEAG